MSAVWLTGPTNAVAGDAARIKGWVVFPVSTSLPAWKAVMFNSKTDEAVLARQIPSTEEL